MCKLVYYFFVQMGMPILLSPRFWVQLCGKHPHLPLLFPNGSLLCSGYVDVWVVRKFIIHHRKTTPWMGVVDRYAGSCLLSLFSCPSGRA